MEMNHHIMAKATTDAVLAKFKSGEWTCGNQLGTNLFRVGCNASFPAPDAAFMDAVTKVLVCFEFKPPTETKRGILTGVGQSIAYLQNCDLSFLVAPIMLEDFHLGEYLAHLFQKQLAERVPVGLILYENDHPESVSIAQNIEKFSKKNKKSHLVASSRFWAKHQDLPVELFHLLLHCYYLKKTHQIEGDAFVYCWQKYLIDPDVATTGHVKRVVDCTGNPIYTLGRKQPISFLDKKLKAYLNDTEEERRKKIGHDINVECTGDSYYNSIRKNYLTFLKHVGVIDSDGNLTDEGFWLYHLGITNGPGSKIFKDYFTKVLMLQGHHLDLMIDLDNIKAHNPTSDFQQVLQIMETEYEQKGMIKRNPQRIMGEKNTVNFLKYELILWRALGLVNFDNTLNWKRITEICLLPE